MTMVQDSPPAVSLREIAAQAWARQQAEVAARRRQEIEEARGRLISDARNALESALAVQPSDPWGVPRVEIGQATFTIDTSDENLLNKPFTVEVGILFLGERFAYRSEGGDPHALFHIYHCPDCGADFEPPTLSNAIGSLSDLGHWLEYAPTIHHCEAQPGCQHCGDPHGVSVPCGFRREGQP